MRIKNNEHVKKTLEFGSVKVRIESIRKSGRSGPNEDRFFAFAVTLKDHQRNFATLEKAFKNTTESLAKKINSQQKGMIVGPGCTVTVCGIYRPLKEASQSATVKPKVISVQLGDSSAHDVTNTTSTQITPVHNGLNQNEKARAEAAGGMVFGARLFREETSSMAMTRALGDPEFQKFGLISTPDIKECDLEGEALTMTDGVSDNVNKQQFLSILSKERTETICQIAAKGLYKPDDCTTVNTENINELDEQTLLIFGNTDGHGGSEVSVFASENLQSEFEEQLALISNLEEKNDEGDTVIHTSTNIIPTPEGNDKSGTTTSTSTFGGPYNLFGAHEAAPRGTLNPAKEEKLPLLVKKDAESSSGCCSCVVS